MKELRSKLIRFVEIKFSNISNICEHAEDIVDEAYLNCLKSKNYNEENENYPYLAKVCTRLAIKQFNLMKWEIKNLNNFQDMEERIPSFQNNTSTSIENMEIKDALTKLRVVEQKILDLKYYKNYTFREICEETGIKLNTILSHHRRALDKLRPHFSNIFDISCNEKSIKKKVNKKHFKTLDFE